MELYNLFPPNNYFYQYKCHLHMQEPMRHFMKILEQFYLKYFSYFIYTFKFHLSLNLNIALMKNN
jgi:hypothetical protein